MSVEFKEDERVVVRKRKILFNGEKVGEIEESDKGNKYHAILKVGKNVLGFSCGLAQGHGDTEVAAIEDAFRSGEQKIKEYALGLEKLKDLYSQGE